MRSGPGPGHLRGSAHGRRASGDVRAAVRAAPDYGDVATRCPTCAALRAGVGRPRPRPRGLFTQPASRQALNLARRRPRWRSRSPTRQPVPSADPGRAVTAGRTRMRSRVRPVVTPLHRLASSRCSEACASVEPDRVFTRWSPFEQRRLSPLRGPCIAANASSARVDPARTPRAGRRVRRGRPTAGLALAHAEDRTPSSASMTPPGGPAGRHRPTSSSRPVPRRTGLADALGERPPRAARGRGRAGERPALGGVRTPLPRPRARRPQDAGSPSRS